MKLSATEETLMHHLWSRERAFMKDLLDAYDDPKPAATTVATLLKRMTDKGLVAYREYGNSREYYPLVTRQAYFANHVNGLIKKFFNNSAAQLPRSSPRKPTYRPPSWRPCERLSRSSFRRRSHDGLSA